MSMQGRTPACIVQGLSISFVGSREQPVRAVSSCNVVLNRGEVVALMGHSGSGKSTLLQAIADVVVPGREQRVVRSGHIQLFGTVGLVLQRPEATLWAETVKDEISLAPKMQGKRGGELQACVSRAMASSGLDPSFVGRDPLHLSGGEQRRVAVAAVLAAEPGVLLLDEPTAGLDAQAREHIYATMHALAVSGTCVVYSTHSMHDVLEASDRVVVMANGTVIDDATTGQMVSSSERLRRNRLVPPLETQLLDALAASSLRAAPQLHSVTEIIDYLAREIQQFAGGDR